MRLRILWVSWFALLFGSAACQTVDNIVFNRSGPTELRLYVSNADGSGERPLSETGLPLPPSEPARRTCTACIRMALGWSA
jgi:hypothetical protein